MCHRDWQYLHHIRTMRTTGMLYGLSEKTEKNQKNEKKGGGKRDEGAVLTLVLVWFLSLTDITLLVYI